MNHEGLSNRHSRKNKKGLKSAAIILGITVALVILISLIRNTSDAFNFSFPGSKLESSDGRVNVLLLGNGGGTHDGADLTDTIMVASYNLKDNTADFISIPRDLWLDEVKGKINSVYEEGKSKGQPLPFTKQVIGGVLGIPINYAVRLDFGGFVKAVDTVDGIDVDVANTFDDYFYPITGKEDDLCGWTEEEKDFSADEAKALNIAPGKQKILIDSSGKIATDSADPDKGQVYFACRFEHIHFDKGVTHMDGTTALKFVRSRHGLEGEGSDFARSARQQKVIEAFREKVLSLNTLTSPSKIQGLLSSFGSSVETDIPIDKMPELYSLSKKVTTTGNYVIDTSGDNPLLINPPLSDYGGAWVLAPKEKNFDRIHQYVQDILSGALNKDEATPSAPALVSSRKKLTEIKQKFSSDNIVVFEKGSDVKEILANLQTVSMFDDNRLVIVENPSEDFILNPVFNSNSNITVVIWFDKELKKLPEKNTNQEILFFPEAKEALIFPLLDLLAAKDSKAFLELNKLKNFDTQYFITMIFYLLRSLTVTPKNAPPFVKNKIARQKQNFSETELTQIYKFVLETDYKIKSGLLDNTQAQFLLVNRFIGKEV